VKGKTTDDAGEEDLLLLPARARVSARVRARR